MKYTVKTELQIGAEEVENLMCSALEGGSNYWCDKFRPAFYPDGAEWGHEAVARGASFTVWHDGEMLGVNNSQQRIEQTLEQMAAEYPKHWEDVVNDNADVITGDIFFQLLCFGEVVYG